MFHSVVPPAFQARGEDTAGLLSWVHLGDLHMKEEGEETHRTLRAIVLELNACFADSVSFMALNAFDIPYPGSFAVLPAQLNWCRQQLQGGRRRRPPARPAAALLSRRAEGRRRRPVHVRCADGTLGEDTINIVPSPQYLPRRPRDRDNALAAWPQHRLLCSQLGPNKHGRQW